MTQRTAAAAAQPEEAYTIPEAAALLRCSKNHVYRLIASGALAATDIAEPGSPQTKYRVRSGSLADYLARQTRAAAGSRPP